MSQDVRDSNGQFIPGDDDGVIGVVFPRGVKIIGNSVSALNGVSKEEHEDIPHGLQPRTRAYRSLEEFIAWCGEWAWCGMVETAGVGRVFFIYDNRPAGHATQWLDGRTMTEDESDSDGEIGGNFGAVINIDIPEYSDWGLASMFPLGGETDQERFDRQVR